MENQKVVRLLGIRVLNDKTVRAVELDFDKFKDGHVVELIGKNGAGKSTVVKGAMSAISGGKSIKDKELLALGLTHEIKLADDPLEVFMGYRVREKSSGVNKGEPINESYLYTRNLEGKVDHNPVIDGISMNASKYEKIITTPITFGMEELYSDNQTIVRKRIEDIYASQLSGLGAEKFTLKVSETRKVRDDLRAECERNSAFMDHFKDEKLDELKLEKLIIIPTEPISSEIRKLEIEKGITLKTPEEAKEKRLAKITEEGREVVEEIRKLNEKREKEYFDYVVLEKAYDKDCEVKHQLSEFLEGKDIPTDILTRLESAINHWNDTISLANKSFLDSEVIKKPTVLPITDGRVIIYEDTIIPKEYQPLMEKKAEIGKRWKTENDTPIDKTKIDTKAIDDKLEQKESEKKVAEHNNNLISRFELWKSWIESKGLHEKEIEGLRKLYAKIETGVDGLRIEPSENNDAHLWLVYNGHHSPDVFDNQKKEYRRLHTYSESQFAIIGILMQAALLDKKPKTARFVVIDGYNMTRESKALIGQVCAEKNIDLLLTRTDDRFKLSELEKGEIVIQNGEILLG